MFDNFNIERFVFEIYTNEICKELFFLNKITVLEKFSQHDRGWLNNLQHEQCKRHSDCLIEKVMDQVFKSYFYLNKYLPDRMTKIFKEFYLCNKRIPNEQLIDYCIRFGEFYERNKINDEDFFYVNDAMMFCFNQLYVTKLKFPNFYSNKPRNWKRLKFIVPPYIRIQKARCNIQEVIDSLKNNQVPKKCQTNYLFSGVGDCARSRRVSQSVVYFFEACDKDLICEKALLELKDRLTPADYKEFLQLEFPAICTNKDILFANNGCEN